MHDIGRNSLHKVIGQSGGYKCRMAVRQILHLTGSAGLKAASNRHRLAHLAGKVRGE